MCNKTKDKFAKVEGKLYNYMKMKAEIVSIQLDIEEIEDNYSGCKGITSGEKTSITNSISNPIEAEVIKREREKEEKIRELRSKERAIKKIDNALTTLDKEEVDLINKRYFRTKSLTWRTIGELLNLSEDRCKQMRVEIIGKIKDLV